MTETNLLEFYEKCENYFIEELGFKPFRNSPKEIEISNGIDEKNFNSDSYSKWEKIDKDYSILKIFSSGKQRSRAFIAVEALASFIYQSIRNNHLMTALVIYRLIHGKSPLNKSEVFQLNKMYQIFYPQWERSVAAEYLLLANLQGISQLLPESMVDESFKKNIFDLANMQQFLKGDSIELIDAILTDNWRANLEKFNFNKDEFTLFIEAALLFQKTKKHFNPEYLNKRLVSKYKKIYKKTTGPKLPAWSGKIDEVKRIFNAFKSSTVSFSYLLDYKKIGIDDYFYFFRANPKVPLELLDFCFENLHSSRFFRDNINQGSVMRFGRILVPFEDHAIIYDFFSFLQNMGIIREYYLVKRTNYLFYNNNILLDKEISYYDQITDRKKNKVISFEFNEEPNFEIPSLDIIDYILFNTLNFIGSYGYGLLDDEGRIKRFINHLKSQYNSLNSTLVNLESNHENAENTALSLEIIKFLEPLSHDITIEKTVTIEHLYKVFIKNCGITTSKLIVKTFIGILTSPFKKAYSLESLYFLNKETKAEFIKKFSEVYENREEITSIVNILQIIQGYLKNPHILDIKLTNRIKKDLRISLEKITYLLNSDESQIKQEFENRIKSYLESNLIQPFMQASLWDRRHYSLKTCLLKGVDKDDKRINILSKLFSYIYIYPGIGVGNNEKLLIIDITVNSSFTQILNDILEILFPREIISSGGYMDKYSNISPIDIIFNNYIFSEGTFISHERDFEEIKTFIKRVLKNIGYISKSDRITAYSGVDSKIEQDNRQLINKIYFYVHKNNPKKIKRNFKEILDFSYESKPEIVKIETNFKGINNNFINSISGLPNYELFGFNYYIFQFKILRPTFQVKEDVISTSEFLLCPGFTQIQSSSDIGYIQNHFIHYIFPKDDIPSNIINYGRVRNLISDYFFMKVLRIYLNYNNHFFAGSEGWKSSFQVWEILVNKILHDSRYHFTPTFLKYDLSTPKDEMYYNNSSEFKTVSSLYRQDLRKTLHLKGGDMIRKLSANQIISPYPELNYEYLGLNEHINILFSYSNDENKKIILMIFSTLPCATIYEVEFFSDENKYQGLQIELFLPNSTINQLSTICLMVKKFLNIKFFTFTPNVHEINPSDFTKGKIKSYKNPYESHIWSERMKKWRHMKYFDGTGNPLSHSERNS